ncbi:regulatory signaling modulator protein AmpE [Aliidiomarina haloalkalitolerans]|nr:regulatory signaling modulator protein AmpE [Aliidiomarina haloalkalitolerans]MCL4408826.1 regulatory signaling modulator protein AmpE [Gammaproteobacteria bacterium]
MLVFSLFIALIIERLRVTPDAWQIDPLAQRWDTWLREHEQMRDWHEHELFGPLLLIAPAILLALLLWLAGGGVGSVLVSVLILTLVIGCRPQRKALRDYFLAAERGDEEALAEAAKILKYSPHEDMTIGRQVIWLNFRYYFAVSFWFVLFGAAGALAYGILRSRAEDYPRLMAWVEWLPLRVAGFAYLLVGHFSRAMPAWLRVLGRAPEQAELQLTEIAVAAEDVNINADDNKSEAELLVNLARRSMILLLVVVAIATLLGWVR